MIDHEAKQAAYAAKRRQRAGLHVAPQTVTRDVRHSGQPMMDTPLRITFRADKEDETREILHKAGMVFADEPDLPGRSGDADKAKPGGEAGLALTPWGRLYSACAKRTA